MLFISEYDAFGPWVYEIDEGHLIPPLFKPYFPSDKPFEMAFKIPREIERRKATPDMDLYDYVVAAYDEEIVVLSRRDKAVDEVRVRYAEIEGISLYRRLLYGVCVLYLKEGKAEIPFNVVSIEILMRFIRLIRGKILIAPADCALPQGISDQELSDILFFNLARDLRDEGEQFVIVTQQPDQAVRYRKPTLMQRLKQTVRPPHLKSAMHLMNDRELLVIERGTGGDKARDSEHSYEYFYLPLQQIQNIAESEDDLYVGIKKCSVHLPHHRFDWRFGAENTHARETYQNLLK